MTPREDQLVESNETIVMTLQPVSGYNLGASSAAVTLVDNDAASGEWPTSWAIKAELPRQRQEARGATVDGKVWVFGGFYSGADLATQQVDYYDIAANKWVTLKNYGLMPNSHSSAVVGPDGRSIYFVGGLFGNFPDDVTTNRVFRFDTVTQTWSEPLPPLPEALSSGGAEIINGKLHYIGGSKADRITDSGRHLVLDLGNPAAGWKDAPALPEARTHFSTVVVDQKIYVIGGQNNHEKHTGQLATVHRYDPATQVWTKLADLPTPKSHAETSTFVDDDGRIVMAGGQVGRFGATDEVVRYDPQANSWMVVGKLPTPLASGYVQKSGGLIVVTIGNRGDGSPRGDTWVAELA